MFAKQDKYVIIKGMSKEIDMPLILHFLRKDAVICHMDSTVYMSHLM